MAIKSKELVESETKYLEEQIKILLEEKSNKSKVGANVKDESFTKLTEVDRLKSKILELERKIAKLQRDLDRERRHNDFWGGRR